MKFTLGLVLGAAIGGLIVHYLDSAEGGALTRRIRRDANDLSDCLSDMAGTVSDKARSLLGKKQEAPADPEEQIVIVGLSQNTFS
jgi:hypothetical protein